MHYSFFVPLTIGLSALLGILEIIYVMSGKEIWKSMTKYCGILFSINFAIGVATGVSPWSFNLALTNWTTYLSQYVRNVFGSSIAIEGLKV